MVKTLKNYFFGPNLHKKVVIIGHAQNKKQFFGISNKSRSSSFRNFLFYPNIICFGSIMNLFLYWVMFFVKNVSFPAKAAVTSPKNLQKQWRFFIQLLYAWLYLTNSNFAALISVEEILDQPIFYRLDFKRPTKEYFWNIYRY